MTPLQLTRGVRSLNRLRQIAQVLTRHGFGHIVAQLNLTRFVPVRVLRERATRARISEGPSAIGQRLAAVCSELGPTFIKVGQLMSTRPDIVPPDVLKELRTLQDEVPPFDSETAMKMVAEDLGRPVDDCFAHIDEKPFASASIGQVYRARLKDGTRAVVKVRRPGVEHTIAMDMQLLHGLAEGIETFMPELRIYRPKMLVDELEQALWREVDYINEASTIARFGHAFAEEVGIRIPRVYWEFTAPRVLTMQELRGESLDDLLSDATDRGIDRRLVARRLAECYLKQVFEVGAFHADPHPGNIIVRRPGSVGLIDFGQSGVLSDELMLDIVALAYACVNNEMNVVMDTFADMGALGNKTDHQALRRSLQILLDKYYGLPMKRLDVGTLFSEFTDIIRRYDVVIPRDFALLVKALGTVGNLTRALNPDLNLLDLLVPHVRHAMRRRFSPAEIRRTSALLTWDVLSIVRRAPSQIRGLLRRLSSHGWELHVRHENIDRLIRELDRSSNRIAFSVVIAAIIVGSSVVFSADTDLQLVGIPVQYFGIMGYLIAGVLGLALVWAIFRSGRLH